MEEEEKRIAREIKLTKFRITIYEAAKAEADRKWKAAEQALNAEQETLRKLEDARDDELWAEAFEVGKIPNYKVEERERLRLIEEGTAEMRKRRAGGTG